MRDWQAIRILNLDPAEHTVFRNFTEAVWARLRHNPRIDIRMDDGPEGARRMTMRVRTGLAQRVADDIHGTARLHRVETRIRVETDGAPD